MIPLRCRIFKLILENLLSIRNKNMRNSLKDFECLSWKIESFSRGHDEENCMRVKPLSNIVDQKRYFRIKITSVHFINIYMKKILLESARVYVYYILVKEAIVTVTLFQTAYFFWNKSNHQGKRIKNSMSVEL